MLVLFFQAEDGIRDLVRSRGLGDVYKRQGATRLDQGFTFDGVNGIIYNTGSDVSNPRRMIYGLSLIHI